MTLHDRLSRTVLEAFVDGLDLRVALDGEEASVGMELPLREGGLALALRASLRDGRPETLVAERGRGIFGEAFDLAATLHAFGIPGLPLRGNEAWHEGQDLLAMALGNVLGRAAGEEELAAVRAAVLGRVESLGFAAERWIDGEVLALLACATEVSDAAYEAMTWDHGARGTEGSDLRPLCRAFPMLAGQITTSKAVLDQACGLPAFERILLCGELDCSYSDRAVPFPPLHPRVVEWLRGLAVRTKLWTSSRAETVLELANAVFAPLPRDLAGVEALMRAGEVAQGLLDQAYRRGYEKAEVSEMGRLALVADEVLASGADWDAVRRAWLERA